MNLENINSKIWSLTYVLLVVCSYTYTGCSVDKGIKEIRESNLLQADSIINKWIEIGKIPGAVLHVSQNGNTIHHKAYGYSQLFEYGMGQYPTDSLLNSMDNEGKNLTQLDSPVLMSTQTIFDLASVTKVMATTMAVMLLVDLEELDIHASVSSYLPEFSVGGKDRITIKDLLTHRSGLPQWLPTYYHASSSTQVYKYICSTPLKWPVDDSRHYSDLGFMTLGFVVEKISGKDLNEFLRVNIYSPLRLKSTGFRPVSSLNLAERESNLFAATSHGNPFEYRMVHDSTFGYQIDGDPKKWSDWRKRTLIGEVNDGNAFHSFGGVAGHAGLFSTAEELGVLLSMLLNKGEFENQPILTPEIIELFLQSTGDKQALGWQIPDYAPQSSFSHTGFTGTCVIGIREQNIGLVLLTNKQNIGVDENTRYSNLTELQMALVEVLTK